ncbi:ATP-binding protein [Minwuia sp.]|uniref:ATP-binding protein n=1 Tax=Minwuia sp. TaxID=2493630 RepID=UPI003A9113CE
MALGIGTIAGLLIVVAISMASLLGILPAHQGVLVGLAGLLAAFLIGFSLMRRARSDRTQLQDPSSAVAPDREDAGSPEPEQPANVAQDGHAREIEALRRDLVRSDSFLEELIAFAPIGLVVVDSSGTIKRANGTVGRMIDADDTLVGRQFVDVFDASVRAAVQNCFAATFAGNTDLPVADLKLRGGGDRVALVNGGLLADGGTEPQAVFYLVDATEQRNLEAQFAQGQRMQAVGQLAGGVAHDFNNLLTAMIGFADLLLMRHPPGDPSYADIVHIKQNANRAAALVRQLLAFSRRQTLRPKVLNLTDVLTDISDLLRRLIGEHLNIRIVHERDLGLVKVDQGQIEQVVTNLVVNARDAMDAGGTVTITTGNVRFENEQRVGDENIPAGDYVEIAVADTGHGITEENLAKIFEPFFTTKAIGHGTGLGLATVYGIVRQTGGYVDVDSRVGEGTTFRILLPQVEQDATVDNARDRRNAVDLTGSGTVLLVEDEDAVRLFAARALRNKGYQLIEAESGEVALAIIEERSQEIDLMISDVVMPNMDGPTLIRRARELRPDMRAVFISGYAEEAFRRSLGDDLGDIDLLPKPFSLKQLAAKVKEQLER